MIVHIFHILKYEKNNWYQTQSDSYPSQSGFGITNYKPLIYIGQVRYRVGASFD